MIWLIILLVVLLQLVGFIWYGPLFGKVWASVIGMPEATDLTPEAKKEFARRMIPVYGLNVLLSILTVFTFGLLESTTLVYPFPLALILFFGIVLPIEASVAMWSGKLRSIAWKMFWVSAGYRFIAFAIIGLVFTLWR